MSRFFVMGVGIVGVILALVGCGDNACTSTAECMGDDVCYEGACTTPIATGSPRNTCDGMGTCGAGADQSGCIGCALKTECQTQLQKCYDTPDCMHVMAGIEACSGDQPGEIDEVCFNSIVDVHPEGFAIYNELAICIFCDVCTSSCAAYSQQCR
ncbi:MAG TPA: hypothetical protein PK156_32185 [Polyangium sp.]|nr:hypothetical protein [Polyangium sp.]